MALFAPSRSCDRGLVPYAIVTDDGRWHDREGKSDEEWSAAVESILCWVRVRVEAFGLNRSELHTRLGLATPKLRLQAPRRPLGRSAVVATPGRSCEPLTAMDGTRGDGGGAPESGRGFSRRPHPALADRVASIAVIESVDETVTVLPSAGAVLGFQYRGRVLAERGALSPAGVTGVQATARRYHYDGPTGSVLVALTAQGAACFGAPAHALSGRSVPLDELVSPSLVREVLSRLADARDDGARVVVVEDALRSLPYERDALVDRALALLDATGDDVERSVAAVARRLSISERQLGRRFRARVGVSPRAYVSLGASSGPWRSRSRPPRSRRRPWPRGTTIRRTSTARCAASRGRDRGSSAADGMSDSSKFGLRCVGMIRGEETDR